MRAEADALPDLLDAVPETTRARLAVHLYGRSHTHELGVRVAATCEGNTLSRVAGLVGNALYDLSRRPYEAPSHNPIVSRNYSEARSNLATDLGLGRKVRQTEA